MITNDTLVHVSRSFKADEYLNPKFYVITTFALLHELGITRHRDAANRVKAELAGGSVVSNVYDNRGTCYTIQIEESDFRKHDAA
jgi:hypothetical protein